MPTLRRRSSPDSLQHLRSRTHGRRISHAGKRLWVALIAPLLLGACSALSGNEAPPQKESARLEISIRSGADLNEDPKGRGAPVLLRVYELKSSAAFEDGEFFALQGNAKAVLGPDLLAVDQFIIRPGEKREIRRKSHPATTAIGIFAGYRDLPSATWRVVHLLPAPPDAAWYRAVIPAHQARLLIDLKANAILLTDLNAATRPVQFANEPLKGLAPAQDGDMPLAADGVSAKVAAPPGSVTVAPVAATPPATATSAATAASGMVDEGRP